MCSLKPELHDAAWCSCCSEMRICVCMFMVLLGCRSAVWCSLICGLPHIGKRAEAWKNVDVILMFALWPSPGALLQFSMCGIRRMFSGRAGMFQKERGWFGGQVSDFILFIYMSGFLIRCILSVFHFVLNFEWLWCPFDV